jgi:hypothetical protein
LFVVAFLATLASASIGSLSGWGFPLQWKIGGCTTINGGLTCAAESDNWLFLAADTLFYTLVGYVFLYLGHAVVPAILDRVAILSPRIILFNALVASIITLATGWLGTGQMASPGGFLAQSYGFPLAWKTTFASCPPPCIQANGTQYDWILLTSDLIFYLTAGYFILLYWLRPPTQPHGFKVKLESVRLLGILALAVIALSCGNYAYDSVYGTGNHWSGYGMLALDHHSFQKANLLTVWLKDIGPGTATANRIYIKNSNGGPVASYALNLTIDQGSLGMISENTTSQGLQLVQNGTYTLQITEGGVREYTFTVTWT